MALALVHDTFALERSYPAAPASVFRAFADPRLKRRWFAEGGANQVETFELDLKEGGSETLRYRMGAGSPVAGMLITTCTSFHDVVSDQRIVASSIMTLGDRRISCALLSFEFRPANAGTSLVFTHQAVFFEGADGPEMRRGGWQLLLDRLNTELAGNR